MWHIYDACYAYPNRATCLPGLSHISDLVVHLPQPIHDIRTSLKLSTSTLGLHPRRDLCPSPDVGPPPAGLLPPRHPRLLRSNGLTPRDCVHISIHFLSFSIIFPQYSDESWPSWPNMTPQTSPVSSDNLCPTMVSTCSCSDFVTPSMISVFSLGNGFHIGSAP